MCDCDFCKWAKEFDERLKNIVDEGDRSFFEDLADRYLDAEMSRDYYKAIVQNKWPDSDQIIERYRKK